MMGTLVDEVGLDPDEARGYANIGTALYTPYSMLLERIGVKALGSNGEVISFEAQSYPARVIQHELDHLDGKVFVDYLSRLKRERIRKQLLKENRNDNVAATSRDRAAVL